MHSRVIIYTAASLVHKRRNWWLTYP